MPSTFVGLLLFTLLSTPGLIYVLITERGARPVRVSSTFRETVTVGVISVAANGVALLIFAVLEGMLPAHTPDVDRLIRNPGPYWSSDYSYLLRWATGVFLLACALAAVTAGSRNQAAAAERNQSAPTPAKPGPRLVSRVAQFFHPQGGVEFVSGWWKLIYLPERRDKAKRITCTLDDGSRVQGWYFSFNSEAGEGPDRDILLSAPLTFREADGSTRFEARGAVCLSARHIVLMQVTYEDHPPDAA